VEGRYYKFTLKYAEGERLITSDNCGRGKVGLRNNKFKARRRKGVEKDKRVLGGGGVRGGFDMGAGVTQTSVERGWGRKSSCD